MSQNNKVVGSGETRRTERLTTSPPPESNRKQSLAYISNLRSSLTALVILHHTACAYGGIGITPVQSPDHAQASSPVLVAFNAFNQSFFMGTFMFLGGHFSARALRRKSTGHLIRDRLWRLGLPTLAYTLFGAPLTIAIGRGLVRGETLGRDFLWRYWGSLKGVRGPVWFTATMLVMDLGLVGARRLLEAVGLSSSVSSLRPRDDQFKRTFSLEEKTSSGLSTAKLFTGLALCSASDFFLRLSHPVGIALDTLGVQPAYLSQYVATHVFGACVDSVEDAIPVSSTATCGLALLSGITTHGLIIALKNDNAGSIKAMMGGWNKIAALYAAWNNITGYLVSGSLLLPLFRRFARHDWGRINALAYPAFLLHMPVLAVTAAAVNKWKMQGLMKPAVVGTMAVAGSWSAAFIVDQVWRAGETCFGRWSPTIKASDDTKLEPKIKES